MKKNFLIIADLDSTFEEFSEGSNEFDALVTFLNKFEEDFNCLITIHFISGTSIEDLAERMEFFKFEYPEIYSRIDYSILGRGKKYSRELNQIGTITTHYAPYNKADGVKDIISCYGKPSICGLCFLGDGKNDVPAFEMVKYYKNQFPYGAYNLAPRSRRDYDEIIGHVDIYSEKPRIVGCKDCLQRMSNLIESKIATFE